LVQLEILEGPGQGRRFEILHPSFTLGRSRTNRVALADEQVSGKHARIRLDADTYFLTDLGSSNGTFVNGERVRERRLQSGDRILIGGTTLEFRADVDETDSAPLIELGPGTARLSPDAPPGADLLDREHLQVAHRHLEALFRVSAVLNSSIRLEEMLARVLDQIFEVMHAERGAIFLLDEEGARLIPQASKARGAAAGQPISVSRTIVQQALASARGVLTPDAMADEQLGEGDSVVLDQIRSAVCVPLRSRGQVAGVIYLDSRAASDAFHENDRDLLQAIGNEVAVAVEKTRLMEANLKAERLAAIGEAVAGLSHYVKNILTCMDGGATVVQRAVDRHDFDALARGWGIVSRSQKKISDLVFNMVTYSAQGRPLRFLLCDVNDIVREAVDLATDHAESKGATLRQELDPEMPNARVDPVSIHRCVLNLLMNALDAVEEDRGEIILRTRCDRSARQVIIEVEDNGCGIPADQVASIFDAFSSTKGGKGTGLGLAVVRKIAEEHGGTISVQSGPEQGSTFTIVLPLHLAEEPDTPPPPSPEEPASPS